MSGQFLRKKWESYQGKKRFLRRMEEVGVDFSGLYICEDPEKWFRDSLEEISQATDLTYSSDLLRTQAQISVLYNQINPHFLYNTLEMIRGLALVRNADEIADMAEILSVMFRYSISNPEEMASFAQELDNVCHYFRIQEYRFGGRFSLVQEVDRSDQELMRCRIPRLSLQPIVENAVVHGLEPKLEGGSVRISAFLTEERMIIRIADNGVGMTMEQSDKLREILRQGAIPHGTGGARHGIALVNINKRLKLYYGEEYGLSFSSVSGEGTIVEMFVPLDKDMKQGMSAGTPEFF